MFISPSVNYLECHEKGCAWCVGPHGCRTRRRRTGQKAGPEDAPGALLADLVGPFLGKKLKRKAKNQRKNWKNQRKAMEIEDETVYGSFWQICSMILWEIGMKIEQTLRKKHIKICCWLKVGTGASDRHLPAERMFRNDFRPETSINNIYFPVNI